MLCNYSISSHYLWCPACQYIKITLHADNTVTRQWHWQWSGVSPGPAFQGPALHAVGYEVLVLQLHLAPQQVESVAQSAKSVHIPILH